jgi:hypothetical protein
LKDETDQDSRLMTENHVASDLNAEIDHHDVRGNLNVEIDRHDVKGSLRLEVRDHSIEATSPATTSTLFSTASLLREKHLSKMELKEGQNVHSEQSVHSGEMTIHPRTHVNDLEETRPSGTSLVNSRESRMRHPPEPRGSPIRKVALTVGPNHCLTLRQLPNSYMGIPALLLP